MTGLKPGSTGSCQNSSALFYDKELDNRYHKRHTPKRDPNHFCGISGNVHLSDHRTDGSNPRAFEAEVRFHPQETGKSRLSVFCMRMVTNFVFHEDGCSAKLGEARFFLRSF